jgi:hypothetical protein
MPGDEARHLEGSNAMVKIAKLLPLILVRVAISVKIAVSIQRR